MSQSLYSNVDSLQMRIGNWDPGKDHCRISVQGSIPLWTPHDEKCGKPWSIEQPILRNLTAETQALCKNKIDQELSPLIPRLLFDLKTGTKKTQVADTWSKRVARIIVEATGSITGLKRSTHKKGKFETPIITKANAQISTISKARDLIRCLSLKEFQPHREQADMEEYLKVCFDGLLGLVWALSPLPWTWLQL